MKLSDVFNALESTLGGFYVNNFNLFGRVWQVNVQADTRFRDKIDDIYRVYVRNAKGTMVPIRAIAQAYLVQGAQAVIRYNGFPGAIINGAAKPGYSSGQALAAMERISATTLPPGYGFEWTGTALQEKAASGKTGIVLGLAVLFAYLFLVALYESWNIPLPVLLSVSVGGLGAIVAVSLSGLAFDVYGQIGLVVLVDARRQEWHFDRRVCRPTAPCGKRHCRLRDRRGATALPAGDDDQLRLHLRPLAAGHRRGRRRAQPPGRRHPGIRRYAGRGHLWDFRGPDALCRVPVAARAHRRQRR